MKPLPQTKLRDEIPEINNRDSAMAFNPIPIERARNKRKQSNRDRVALLQDIYYMETLTPKPNDMSEIQYWQRCPICNGTGLVHKLLSNNIFDVCDTCRGQKIISTITGKPPVDKTDIKITGIRQDDTSQGERN